jgi:predicted phage terminase large subunit-like protein
MQRLHEEDLTGWLLKGGNGEKWEHLCIPVLDADDNPLWPFKHDRETLLRMESSNRYVFTGQYMQRPSPLGGGIIKGQWFGRYSIAPKMKYRKIYADTAQKTAERNDYSVFECWGHGEDNRIYLLDMIRGKWEAPELKRRAVEFWNKHAQPSQYGALRKMVVEDKASGTGLIQDIRHDAKIPVQAQQRNKDKLTRVMDVTAYIESGYVMIPADAPFTSDFVSECEGFTADDSHMHDDQIDPMCDAINDMLIPDGDTPGMPKMRMNF